MKIISIDPGKKGAIVWLNADATDFYFEKMPLDSEGKIDFIILRELLNRDPDEQQHIFSEKPNTMGVMGATQAFNYGVDFGLLLSVVIDSELPYTLVEPNKWTKIIHAGIDSKYKPKAKSQIAVKRLFPKFLSRIPKTKPRYYSEGVVDALLIAEYGRRQL